MKTIYLVRHGKAASPGKGINDFRRPLLERAENDVRQVAKRLKERGVKPSLILTSPAIRAYASARLFARELGYRTRRIRTRKALYDLEDGEKFMDLIQIIGDNYDSIVLVGHNPSLTDFAWFLVQDFQEVIPTSGVVGIEFKSDSWKEIIPGQGELIFFEFPEAAKEKSHMRSKGSEAKEPPEKGLADRINESIRGVLKELEADSTIKKPLKKSLGKLARKFMKKVEKTIKEAK